MSQGSTVTEHDALISHTHKISEKLSYYQKRLSELSSYTLSLEEEQDLLKQLTEFELGRFLLSNQGLNGYWTSYIISNDKKNTLHPLESWILQEAPTVMATRERYNIFKQQLQNHIHSGMEVASLPCGLMNDLFTLDYSSLSNLKLTGIDLDPESILLAKTNPNAPTGLKKVFKQQNAWDLDISNQFDILTSNGLNIYQPDDQKVKALYKAFNKSMKTGGILITSFLTPPPFLSDTSPWKNYSTVNAMKQKAIFVDIIQAHWQAYRTECETRQQLKLAGFEVLNVIEDTQGMFPTVVARKI